MYVHACVHRHTHTPLLLWYTLSNHGRRAGPKLKGLGAVYSQSFVGEVASLMPDFPWTEGLLGAWLLMAVDGRPFLSRTKPRGCVGRLLKTAEDHSMWFAGTAMVDLCLICKASEWRFLLTRTPRCMHFHSNIDIGNTVQRKQMCQLRAKQHDSLASSTIVWSPDHHFDDTHTLSLSHTHTHTHYNNSCQKCSLQVDRRLCMYAFPSFSYIK